MIAMVEGIQILSFRQVPDEKASKAMALVAAADYVVKFREGSAPEGWQEKVNGFLAQDSIKVVKTTKKRKKRLRSVP